jgi:hypothetical protein
VRQRTAPVAALRATLARFYCGRDTARF